MCPLCKGSGSFFVVMPNWGMCWYDCPACGGDGVTSHPANAKPIVMKVPGDAGRFEDVVDENGFVVGQKFVSQSSGEPVQTFAIKDFPEGSLLAHVMAKAGIFPSVSEARKNGWNKPITPGEYKFKKKQKTIVVTA